MGQRLSERDDWQDISQVLLRFTSGIGRRDWALFRTAFTDDCQVDLADYGSFNGVDAITEFETASHAEAGHTLHRMTNHVISVDGDQATARTYVDAWIMSVDGASGINALGIYDDELVRTDDGWRIARRKFTSVRLSISNT